MNLASDIVAIAPPLIMVVFAMIVLMADLMVPEGRKGVLAVIGFVACFAAAGAAAWLASVASLDNWDAFGVGRVFGGGIISDGFAHLFSIILAIVAALSILLSDRYLEQRRIDQGEYYALILFSTSGAMIMGMANDLVNVFLGLEILSVSLYILSGVVRRDARSQEAAVKYFLLGAFATGFLLYGAALVYGSVGMAVAGTPLVEESYTNFATIYYALHLSPGLATSPIFIAGVALLIVGLGFKAAIVPFHVWTPDVYEGAPTSVTAFMSVAAKAGAFAAFIRVVQATDFAHGLYGDMLWGLAAATMIVGNVLALRQVNIKRMLAYSSIAHAGYILVGIVANNSLSHSAVLYYMFAYTFMNLGAFAVVIWLTRGGREYLAIQDYRGLSREQPLAAALMAVFMVSLAGLPPAAGFFGKLYLFLGAVQAGLIGLAALGLLVSVIGVFYYLNVIVQMYFYAPEHDFAHTRSVGARSVAIIAAVGTLLLGIFAFAARGFMPSPQPGRGVHLRGEIHPDFAPPRLDAARAEAVERPVRHN